MKQDVKIIDFDHHSPAHSKDWGETYKEMRANCPVAWTEAHGGYWVVTRYDDVGDIARDTDTFSSAKWQDDEGTWQGGNTLPTISGRLIPDETDPPEWKMYRHLLNPWFTPKAVAQYKDLSELVASLLVDAVIEKGEIDMIQDLANPLPAIMTLHMMGLPLEQWREYAEPSHEAIYCVPGTPEYARALVRLQWGEDQMAAACRDRRGKDGTDLISYIANAQNPDGSYFSDEVLGDICRQVLGGGIDTTTSLLANVFIYLSEYPEERRRLIDEPEISPFACEEFVRFFCPIHSSSRTLKQPAEVAGVKMAEGDKVLIAYASANRDPTYFEDPDVVKLDRFPNPHIGFGVGIHRCLGSHVARQSFQAQLNEVLRRMPDYRIEVDKAEQYGTTGVVNGWVCAPATFPPDKKENRDPVLARRLGLEG